MKMQASNEEFEKIERRERLAELEAMERSLDPRHDPEASGRGMLDGDEIAELRELRKMRDGGEL